MLFIKKQIKICIVPGCEEERLIGYRFQVVSEIMTRSVIPFELLWKWNPRLCFVQACGAGLPSAGVPGLGTGTVSSTSQASFCLMV